MSINSSIPRILNCFFFIGSFSLDGTLIKLPLTYPSSDQLAVGYAHAIADMNHDSAADLIVTVKSSGSAIKYQVLGIDLEKNQYKMLEEYATPSDSYLYGQSLFADFGLILFIHGLRCTK